jgi:hypothetical protein
MADKFWVEAPEEVVLRVLGLNSMQISEPSLFVNLLRWGHAQVKDVAQVRAKIDNCLKLIRFCAMDLSEFSGLCCRPLPLTTEEKYKIFLGISQQNDKHLPEGFSRVMWPRCMGQIFDYNWMPLMEEDEIFVDNTSDPFFLNVAVEPEHHLTGLQLHSLTNINAGELVHLTCSIYSSEYPNLCITTATFNGIVPEENDGELVFPRPVLMKKGIVYSIELTYQHAASRLTAEFFTGRTYTWDSDSDEEGTIVVFALDDEPVSPILDICGLLMAQKIE